jgi:hypothetical protein
LGDGLQRQEQLERLAWQGDEAELLIELGYLIVQGIDDDGVYRHHLAGFGDTLQGIGE